MVTKKNLVRSVPWFFWFIGL